MTYLDQAQFHPVAKFLDACDEVEALSDIISLLLPSGEG